MKKKRYLFTLLLVTISCAVNAQYKKASFLNKSGRTHELGLSTHLLSGGRSMVSGISYGYGRDQGKRFFHWYDLEVLLPSKFAYTTVADDGVTPISITGKSKLGLAYRYNLAFNLIDNTNEENKFMPFVTAGINMLVFGGSAKSYEQQPQNFYPVLRPTEMNFSFGANAGLGAIYSFTPKVGGRVTGGYNYQTNVSSDDDCSTYKVYHVFTPHPYATLGLRFRIENDD